MILLNFAHSVTPAHIQQINGLLINNSIDEVREYNAKIDSFQPLEPQAQAIAALVTIQSSDQDWIVYNTIINPPVLAPLALVLMRLLHYKIGYSPLFIRFRPVSGPLSGFVVAEILKGD